MSNDRGNFPFTKSLPFQANYMSEEKEKKWLKAGIELSMENNFSRISSECIEAFKYGSELGEVAAITPELADLSQKNIDRLYRGWKKHQGIDVS